ncbi:hypothetical protein CIB48_g2500 [Xylaria polymorpha]|nr:hypothetical protein CIB48_g2500 [Xylaria polymorpha]
MMIVARIQSSVTELADLGEVGIAYHRQPYSLAPSHQEPIVVTRYLAGVDDDDIDSFIDIVTHPTVPTYIHTAVPTYHVVLGKLVRKGAGPLPIPLHSDTLPPCLPPNAHTSAHALLHTTPTPTPAPATAPSEHLHSTPYLTHQPAMASGCPKDRPEWLYATYWAGYSTYGSPHGYR